MHGERGDEMEIRALVTDLDDTLLDASHRLSERSERTLHRLQRQGVKVILASGRSAASMRPFVKQVGSPDPFIACNGAQTIDPETGKILFSYEIEPSLAREAIRWLREHDLYAQFYAGDDWFYDRPCAYSADYCRSSGVVGIRVADLEQALRLPTPKLLAVDTPERIQALLPEARAAFAGRLSVTTSKPFFMEITTLEATKGNALAKLATRLGLDAQTTICAGDSINDLSMLAWSRLPVTVANAREEVKNAAWRVAGDGHSDGLAILLDELIPEV